MTDLAALLTALGVFLTAVGGFVTVLRRVEKVHTIVNSNNAAMVKEQKRLNERVEQLVEAISASGGAVPERPNE